MYCIKGLRIVLFFIFFCFIVFIHALPFLTIIVDLFFEAEGVRRMPSVIVVVVNGFTWCVFLDEDGAIVLFITTPYIIFNKNKVQKRKQATAEHTNAIRI